MKFHLVLVMDQNCFKLNLKDNLSFPIILKVESIGNNCQKIGHNQKPGIEPRCLGCWFSTLNTTPLLPSVILKFIFSMITTEETFYEFWRKPKSSFFSKTYLLEFKISGPQLYDLSSLEISLAAPLICLEICLIQL